MNSAIQLDLTQAEFRPGLICDNTFVLCEGNYDNEVLRVTGISLPPPEETTITRYIYDDTRVYTHVWSTTITRYIYVFYYVHVHPSVVS